MAAVTVKIIYTGAIVEDVRAGEQIARYFAPMNSYVDTDVMVKGYANANQVGDKETYGKSIYATNVDGWGTLPGLLPNATTVDKITEFELAKKAAAKATAEGTANKGITFEIEGYEAELYWNQMAENIFRQGFYVEVGDNKYGTEPTSDSDTDTDTDTQ